MRQRVLGFLFVLTCVILGRAQNQVEPTKSPFPDLARESFVIEQMTTRMRFESDGTARRETNVRVRVQDANAVQQFGQLAEAYNSANEKLEFTYVRVRKQDGSVVPAPESSIQDVTGPIGRIAPVYSDYREKHVTVPALRPGDTLEWQVVTTTTVALAAGQFWASYHFAGAGNAIVLDEQLEINVPAAKKVTLKTAPAFQPKLSDDGSRRVYRWASAHKVRETDDELKKAGQLPPDFPEVQLTTFDSWEQVGQWYASLERDRREPTQKIKERASSLVAGRSTDADKAQALYDFVARNFRYVSLSFGVGRYQPHAAEEVLGNEYGDCKDKNTLLRALLEAVGIESGSALVNSSAKIDSAVPSPAQFNHVITVARVGSEMMWMDTTAEVAPFRLLMPSLRNKRALVIAADKPAQLMTTPAEAPFAQRATVELDGKISALGKLDARVKQVFQGDAEVAYLLAFRSVGQANWSKALEFTVAQQGIAGTVTEANVAAPTAGAPTQIAYKLEVPNFFDWAKKKATVAPPLGNVSAPSVDEDSTEPIDLGGAGDYGAHIRLEFPESTTVRVPLPVHLSRPYAEYTSEYKKDGHTVTIDRKLVIKQRELERTKAADFTAFRRAIEQDQKQEIALENNVSGEQKVPESAKADELNSAGLSAYANRQYAIAADLLKRVVELEPKHKFAWNNLGRAYRMMGKLEDATAAFRKQIEINPYDEFAYNNLGLAYQSQNRDDDAIAAFQKQIEINPLDKWAHKNVGQAYGRRKQFDRAAEELAKAAQITPDDSDLQVELGHAYLESGKTDEALATFDAAVQRAPIPPVWNNIAYYLAEKKVALPRAEQYAESSVRSTEAMLRNLTADNFDGPQGAAGSFLAAAWDTLGWIKYQKGDVDGAEQWIRAAWILEQHGEVADHLGQIYEKRGNKDIAKKLYAQALASPQPQKESRKRLGALLGGEAGIDALVSRARGELSEERTVKLGKLSGHTGTAEFTILLSPGPKVEVVKFVSGDEKLKQYAAKLETVHYDVVFPEKTDTRLAIHGFLSCSATNGECLFVRGVGTPGSMTMTMFVPGAASAQ
jgi:tetratricopeptide (TPR) repeat protein/transglutaminase-like putative cysteine protease